MNRHIIAGRIANDPELKILDSGKQICKFKVAAKRKYSKEKTDFFPIVAWGEVGDTIVEYFKKGDPIEIIGETHINTNQDKSGKWHTNIEVEMIEFYFPLQKAAKETGGNGIEQSQENRTIETAG